MLRSFCLVVLFVLFVPIASFAERADSDNPYLQALPSWENTLKRFVDTQGRTDFKSLANDTAEIEMFIAAVAEVSPASNPELFTSTEQVLAYHINAYNALAMWGVIERGIPNDFSSFFKRASFFKFRSVVIGGKKTNLYDYENRVIRPLNEARVHFVLNCMVRDCPRLPTTVFTPETLERDLQAASVEFFSTSRNVKVDHSEKTVGFSGILKFYTKDYVESGKKQDLIPYVNQFIEQAIPLEYKVGFIDYDWTVNQQPVPADKQG